MQSTHVCELLFPDLSPAGRQGHIIPALKSSSLLSLGQLCDDNCTIVLTKPTIYIIKNDKIIITGTRDFNNGMWYVDIPSATPSQSLSPLPAAPTPSPPPTSLINSVYDLTIKKT